MPLLVATPYSSFVMLRVVIALSVAVTLGAPASAQPNARVAFAVGEAQVYDVKFGPLTVGSGKAEVIGIDTIRGRPAYHLRLDLRAGIPGFRVSDVLESWLDITTLSALRFRQSTNQGSKVERRDVELFPDRQTYEEVISRPGENGKGPEILKRTAGEAVPEPLDQASFLYWVRSQPLDVGQTYSIRKYYKPANNPVTLGVNRKESVTVPAGQFDAIVVRPRFVTKGIFGQNGRAEVWLTDDSRRLMVRMETHVSFGTITLLLKEFQ